jgi:hypothetical protein
MSDIQMFMSNDCRPYVSQAQFVSAVLQIVPFVHPKFGHGIAGN